MNILSVCFVLIKVSYLEVMKRAGMLQLSNCFITLTSSISKLAFFLIWDLIIAKAPLRIRVGREVFYFAISCASLSMSVNGLSRAMTQSLGSF